ncbi:MULTISPECIES: hypothetical protein [unclassified Tenacibaculum]|uniref:hypothetical protein n=1 Tax=unclassified Tenacibaculum TaxID=2635139 RepID=UPI001F39FDDD|nr:MULTISPECIES: hypothetical protein [unclassified Tenacibaculum]MCF2875746.1 hypothetical protein [Tenacibaculum sp. Cn5-1]MCF2935822.1 hypothetical protein [Tenacibaculum sp. Cn5-34]MCG7512382.1 hypothetical protein [Tenacibaculum sp. Cn5-46]
MSLNINNLIDKNLPLIEKLTRSKKASTSIWRLVGLDNKELSDVYECNRLGDEMEAKSLIKRKRAMILNLTAKGKKILKNGGWLKHQRERLKEKNTILELTES